MSAPSSPAVPRIVLIGVGHHSGRIGRLLLDRGFALAGAVDPAHAGRPLREILGHAAAPDLVIAADIASLPDAPADVAIVTAPVGIDALGAIAEDLFRRGLDVLTIHPDVFDPPDAWAEAVDAAARRHGKSILSTGVQDHWWVHMPALAAASMTVLASAEFTHHTDADTFSRPLAEHFGIGGPASAFDRIREDVLLAEAPVLGGPLRVFARRLGLTPGAPTRTVAPLTADVPVPWRTGDTVVRRGDLIGFVETVEVATEEGIPLRGLLRTGLLLDGELPLDRTTLVGDPTLRLEHAPFPGDRITDVIPVARIADILVAAPGLHTAATLPPASYLHRVPTLLPSRDEASHD